MLKCGGEIARDPEALASLAEDVALCAHVGVAFDPAMLEFGESARRLVSDEEMSWKSEIIRI